MLLAVRYQSNIIGIRNGLRGFYDTERPPLALTDEFCSRIHYLWVHM